METIFNEIARTIKEDTKGSISNAVSSLELQLGTITSTGLKMDNFKYEVQDYMVLDYLKSYNEYATEIAGEHPHSHVLKIPKNLKALFIGDRVLVATVGNEYIVVGRVVNA
ncbi:hypothetical protein NZ45_07990 [Clostridium botulinum]|uniref:DUF2577 domain-containing protein n=1 Tax=Clostridium botulinum TaxID=1491 RepID=A0ABD7CG53_CLOBO|nr:hypothetical protein [Clostridium botulinum]KGO14292.1 hypothetical protein NZ45_07990 [Clostridium botulinum]QRI52254.1 hypothetical protein JQS73_12530 [Clostridium botulinum]